MSTVQERAEAQGGFAGHTLARARLTLKGYWRLQVMDWLFNRRVVSLLFRCRHVWCLGDSHVGILRFVEVPGVRFRPRARSGASAMGIVNPNSKTGALKTFSEVLNRAKPWQEVLLLLGEVDCGFVIWHRAERLGVPVQAQLEASIEAYSRFIASVIQRGYRRVTVLSVPLPTITDRPSEWGEVANLRSEITATQRQRTDLTLQFNERLQQACARLGASFVDITTGHLDAATQLIDRQFLPASYHDHHLAHEPFRALIQAELRKTTPLTPETPAPASREGKHGG